MRVCDIAFIDGCTGEIIMDITSPNNLDREVVKVEIENNIPTYWTVLPEDLAEYYAFEYSKYIKMPFADFLAECSCCGGDWVSMLFTGMKRVFPKVWEVLPEDKKFSFMEVIDILESCGVLTSAEEK